MLAACGGDDPGTVPDDSGSSTVAADEPSDAPSPAPEPLLGDGDDVVLIGDSLATEAPPTYADLLPAAAADRGASDVETSNLAEPGTTSADWLPGTPLFEERLVPALADADLVLITVGGNDLQEGIGATDGVEALGAGGLAAADGAFDAIDASGRNLRKTFAAIHEINPEVKIAYVAYPDYSASTAWQQAGGTGANLALGIGLSGLLDAAADAGPDEVVDMLAATGQAKGGIDPLLADDPEYLSPEGHQFYAEEIASALAG